MPDLDELSDWLREKLWLLFLLAAAGVWGVHSWLGRPISRPAGMVAPEEPLQGPPSVQPWVYKGYRMTPLASFDIRARILSRERYYWDRAADLSPLDLALGWGLMSDTAVIDKVRIRQSDRWYYWSNPDRSLPVGQVIAHSANMHMIPADGYVKARLLELREGAVVHLKGQLVRAEGPDHWTWVSSLSRTDSGDGACEVIWVQSVDAR